MENEKSNNGIIMTIVIVVILIILGLIFLANYNDTEVAPVIENTPSTNGAANVQDQPAANATSTAPQTMTVSYDGTNFSPASITIRQGDTVRFVNNSDTQMWVASGPHPAHTNYPGFDELTSVVLGGSYSFTFDRVGSWGYHNHLKPASRGAVVVQ